MFPEANLLYLFSTGDQQDPAKPWNWDPKQKMSIHLLTSWSQKERVSAWIYLPHFYFDHLKYFKKLRSVIFWPFKNCVDRSYCLVTLSEIGIPQVSLNLASFLCQRNVQIDENSFVNNVTFTWYMWAVYWWVSNFLRLVVAVASSAQAPKSTAVAKAATPAVNQEA